MDLHDAQKRGEALLPRIPPPPSHHPASSFRRHISTCANLYRLGRTHQVGRRVPAQRAAPAFCRPPSPSCAVTRGPGPGLASVETDLQRQSPEGRRQQPPNYNTPYRLQKVRSRLWSTRAGCMHRATAKCDTVGKNALAAADPRGMLERGVFGYRLGSAKRRWVGPTLRYFSFSSASSRAKKRAKDSGQTYKHTCIRRKTGTQDGR